jgi:transcriptional regulator with XRE-family HTH domain
MSPMNPQRVLRAHVARYETQRACARALRISPSYLCDLLRGRRPYSARILRRLGLKRIVARVVR